MAVAGKDGAKLAGQGVNGGHKKIFKSPGHSQFD
jgi:hypothetical protein